MKNKNSKKALYQLVLIAMFIAIMLVMNFTPIGYITVTGAFSITLMTIPVALGATCTGVTGGTILGFVFGLTSFLQAFGIGFMIDPSATPLFTENPLGYTITCFVPRILTGFLAGLVFSLFEKRNKIKTWAFGVSAAIVPVLNTALFMTFYIVFYSDTSFGGAVMTVILTILTINFLVEFLVTMFAGISISKPVYTQVKKMSR
ncbi:MAG: ECF transporter S component [Acutalibacteraceae bacterium]|nr:ECF transporter S component [Acutalibacteraceae bacterium]